MSHGCEAGWLARTTLYSVLSYSRACCAQKYPFVEPGDWRAAKLRESASGTGGDHGAGNRPTPLSITPPPLYTQRREGMGTAKYAGKLMPEIITIPVVCEMEPPGQLYVARNVPLVDKLS